MKTGKGEWRGENREQKKTKKNALNIFKLSVTIRIETAGEEEMGARVDVRIPSSGWNDEWV